MSALVTVVVVVTLKQLWANFIENATLKKVSNLSMIQAAMYRAGLKHFRDWHRRIIAGYSLCVP